MSRTKSHHLKVTHIKGGGPGGQNRNKRMSGVRIEHLPTGITTVATERRSQKQNLAAGLKRIEEKLARRVFRAKPRKKTVPSHSSKLTRLDNKKIQSQKKKLRNKRSDPWD